MNRMRYYVIPAILCLFCSCQCEKYKCPAFNNGDATIWLPTKNLVFYNESSNQELTFIASSIATSETYGEDETTLSFSCNQNDCFASANYSGKAFVAANTDSLVFTIEMKNLFEGKKLMSTVLNYTIGDMSASFSVRPEMSFAHGTENADWYADSIKEINTGKSILSHVMIQTRKVDKADAIAKTYWSAEYGLIGFAFKNGKIYWAK